MGGKTNSIITTCDGTDAAATSSYWTSGVMYRIETLYSIITPVDMSSKKAFLLDLSL
jgi:hypothetical protein